jgi:endonuclease I
MKKIKLFPLLVLLLLASCGPSPASSSDISSTSLSSLTQSESETSYVSSFSSSSDVLTSTSTSSSSMETSSDATDPSISLPTYTYSGYYEALNGVADELIVTTLRPILRSVLDTETTFPVGIDYGAARDVLQVSDRDPNNPNNIILVYRQTSVPAVWDGGSTWNREHVWPQSLLNISTSNTSRHVGADMHNLKPANPSENTSRGNKYFNDTLTTTSYAPPNVVKGDIARILFYMVTMWPNLSLVDVATGSPATFQMAQFSTLVKWHLQDPVDDFERNRNEVIYDYQGNRNPYIDHEELVCRAFRHQTALATQYCAA